jgi:response regulator NasT
MAIRVLVADDDPLLAFTLSQILTARGFEVVGLAGSGVEALALAERLRPDVAVLDLLMPGGDGITIARRLQRERRVPVILLSGDPRADALARALGLTVQCLPKPVRHHKLVAAVRAAAAPSVSRPATPRRGGPRPRSAWLS